MKEKLIDKINPLKDYVKDEDGNYIYKGKLYKTQLNEEKLSSIIKKLWLLIVALFMLWLLGGFLRFRGIMYSFSIILVYCLEIINLLVLFRSLFVLNNNKSPLSEKDYKKSILNFPLFSSLLVACLFFSILFSVIFVIKNGFNNDVAYFVLYLTSKILMILLSISFFKTSNKAKYTSD